MASLVKRSTPATAAEWLYHMLPSVARGGTAEQAIKGQTLNKAKLRQLAIDVPPLSEQRRIADVLNTADEAIRQTDAVIAKLKLMKQGLLNDLLTLGLDGNGELRNPIAHPEEFKDSPLGRIPREWDVRTADSVCREIVVGIVVKPTQYYTQSGVPVLRSANVKDDGLDPSDLVFISERSNRMLSKSIIRAGDVLTVRTGYPGTSAVVPPAFDGSNCVDIIVSRPGPEIVPDFLTAWINSDFGKGQVLRAQGGLAQQHFNVGDLKKLLVATPRYEEQLRICEAADTIGDRIRAEVTHCDKLQLLKKGLLQDLLTGRVRVPMPEAQPEPIEVGA